MEIYQLRTFVTVARESSITRAWELLFLSQPAVSAHIKAMEDELGLVLFDRTPRGMGLTSHGVKLLAKA
ncbi:MAG TPA: LysR family transcriptional regulator, partial [Promineifilum sp.]